MEVVKTALILLVVCAQSLGENLSCDAWLAQIGELFGNRLNPIAVTQRVFVAKEHLAGLVPRYVIVSRNEMRVLGDMHVSPTNASGTFVSVPIQMNERGQGYGTEGKAAFLQFLFHDKKIHGIVDTISPFNIASIRMHTKLGYRSPQKTTRYFSNDYELYPDLFAASLHQLGLRIELITR